MKKDKRYYTALVEEFSKILIKDKNKISNYADTQLKKPYGCMELSFTTTDDKIQVGFYMRRKD